MRSCTKAKTAVACTVSIIVFCGAAFRQNAFAAEKDEQVTADRPVLQVPQTGSKPEIDGKLDEPFWKQAARTGPLERVDGKPANSKTEAFVARDAEHLYVGVVCGMNMTIDAKAAPDKGSGRGELSLLVDSNGDRNSFYLITVTPTERKKERWAPPGEYREHWPPWQDLWRLRFRSVVAEGENGWTAEVSIPFDSFQRNRTLTPEIGFNVRRRDTRGEIHCWHGEFSNPREGWTSIYNPARNEPFETACWISRGGYGAWAGGRWVKPYVPGVSTSYSYMCFDNSGRLYISDGAGLAATGLTRKFAQEFEFNVAGKGPAGSALRKFRLGEGVRIEHARDFRFNGVEELPQAQNSLGVAGNPGGADTQFNGPCGLAVDGDHLVVQTAVDQAGRATARIKRMGGWGQLDRLVQGRVLQQSRRGIGLGGNPASLIDPHQLPVLLEMDANLAPNRQIP